MNGGVNIFDNASDAAGKIVYDLGKPKGQWDSTS